MREFSLLHLNRKSSEVTAVANREPVALTHHRTPRYVLMSYEDFKAMTARIMDGRRVFDARDTPDDVAQWLLPALDKFAEGGDPADG